MADESTGNWLQDIQNIVADLEKDYDKFNINGNKAAGTRLRKNLMVIIKECKAARTLIQEQKNAETK